MSSNTDIASFREHLIRLYGSDLGATDQELADHLKDAKVLIQRAGDCNHLSLFAIAGERLRTGRLL